ncbi:hypothetical protein [Belliella pelovolcani]|uniref:hypothetical protein n=1 Tax=Belliella pelovolcani TaxID=529505 RepID=UPI00391DCBA8
MTNEFDFSQVVGLTIDYWCNHDQIIKSKKIIGEEGDYLIYGWKKSNYPGKCTAGCKEKCMHTEPWQPEPCKGEMFPLYLHKANFRGISQNQQIEIFKP